MLFLLHSECKWIYENLYYYSIYGRLCVDTWASVLWHMDMDHIFLKIVQIINLWTKLILFPKKERVHGIWYHRAEYFVESESVGS